jgi:hypothetical protein
MVPQVPAIARVDLSVLPRAGVEAGAEGGAGRGGREGVVAGDADTLRHVKTNVIAVGAPPPSPTVAPTRVPTVHSLPPSPTVAPTRVPTVHSLPLEQGCCLALGLRYAGWRPFPYSSACPSATMIIVLVQYGRGVSR